MIYKHHKTHSMRYSVFFAALVLMVSCGTAKKTDEKEKPVTRTEDLKPANPQEVTVEGAGTTPDNGTKPGKPVLQGSWQLEKVYGAKEPFNMLFPGKVPTATFDLRNYTLTGNNGCNQYNGPFTLRNGVLGIGDMMATKMFCEGVKEQLYMTTLKMANGYKFEGDKLVLTLDGEGLMAFRPIK